MPKASWRDLDGIKTHPLFKNLNEKQQAFFVAYIESNCDRRVAVDASYGEGKSIALASKMLGVASIRQLVALYFGYEVDQAPMGKTELLGLISARLRNTESKDSDFAKLADCFLEVKGSRAGKAGRPSKEDSEEIEEAAEENVNELVLEVERKVKAKAQSNE